jgi:hypothetical protein
MEDEIISQLKQLGANKLFIGKRWVKEAELNKLVHNLKEQLDAYHEEVIKYRYLVRENMIIVEKSGLTTEDELEFFEDDVKITIEEFLEDNKYIFWPSRMRVQIINLIKNYLPIHQNLS